MDLAITNVHLDLGAGLRGTDMGPSAIHVAGLAESILKLGHKVIEFGWDKDPNHGKSPLCLPYDEYMKPITTSEEEAGYDPEVDDSTSTGAHYPQVEDEFASDTSNSTEMWYRRDGQVHLISPPWRSYITL